MCLVEAAFAENRGKFVPEYQQSSPILDSRLPDGSRVAAVIPPCSLTGVTLTIRKFGAPNFGLPELIATRSITQEAAALLVKAVLDRQNILISGGIRRTALEDCFLETHLPGYDQYKARVRYRLCCGIW